MSLSGLIVIKLSGQGSIRMKYEAWKVYRGSKATLDVHMKSFATQQDPKQLLTLMALGGVKGELRGPDGSSATKRPIPS